MCHKFIQMFVCDKRSERWCRIKIANAQMSGRLHNYLSVARIRTDSSGTLSVDGSAQTNVR